MGWLNTSKASSIYLQFPLLLESKDKQQL